MYNICSMCLINNYKYLLILRFENMIKKKEWKYEKEYFGIGICINDC